MQSCPALDQLKHAGLVLCLIETMQVRSKKATKSIYRNNASAMQEGYQRGDEQPDHLGSKVLQRHYTIITHTEQHACNVHTD